MHELFHVPAMTALCTVRWYADMLAIPWGNVQKLLRTPPSFPACLSSVFPVHFSRTVPAFVHRVFKGEFRFFSGLHFHSRPFVSFFSANMKRGPP
ncbi:hypothetical protein, partial [Akkermansia sp. BIOML-A7]|uniref:hypothetical protein n=1 Tax=Akkermansia sp. BIOML-A7 TaxID=2584563 RepID=UPI00195B1A03